MQTQTGISGSFHDQTQGKNEKGSSDSDVDDYLNISSVGAFAQLVRKKRLAREWTLLEMAKHAGYSEGHQVRIEYGEVIPPPETARNIANALEMPPEIIAVVTQCLRINKDNEKKGIAKWVTPREMVSALLKEVRPCISTKTLRFKKPKVEVSVPPVEKFRSLVKSICEQVDAGKITPEDAHKIADEWKATLEC